MNLNPFKTSQTLTDLSNAYSLTVRSLISCTFEFAMRNSKITDAAVLQKYKRCIVFALFNGSEHAITNHSVIGSNDIFALLPFMQEYISPSEKLTTDNFYKDNTPELVKALNDGVDLILAEIIDGDDNFTDKEKNSMKTALKEFVVTEDEVTY